MKKHIALLLSIAALSMTACGNGKNNDKGQEPPAPTPVTATVTYSITGGSDITTLFNIEAEYTDTEGQTVTETVDALPWEKSIENVEVPYSGSLKMKITAVENYEAKESYNVGLGGSIGYITSDNRMESNSSSSTMTIAADKTTEYQETIVSRADTYNYTVEIAEK